MHHDPDEPILVTPQKIKEATDGALTRTTCYRLLDRDETFPRLRQISPGRVAWLYSEIREWLLTRPQVGTPEAVARRNRWDAAEEKLRARTTVKSLKAALKPTLKPKLKAGKSARKITQTA